MKNNRFLKLSALAAATVFVFMGNVTEAYAQIVFDSVSGGYVEASASDYIECIDCAGDGICPHCDGNGEKTTALGSWGCTFCQRSGMCSTCGGSGKGSVCHTCGGDGKYRGSSIVVKAFNKNKCLDCDGRGYESCSLCKGSGIID